MNILIILIVLKYGIYFFLTILNSNYDIALNEHSLWLFTEMQYFCYYVYIKFGHFFFH